MVKKFIIGIDLGGTNLKIALLDLKYKIRHKKVLGTKKFSRKESLILEVVSSVNKIIQDNNLKRANILGVGLGLPGPIDSRNGLVHFFPNIPGWKEVKLRDILKRKLRLPIFLDNDANLMALAEFKLGAAKGSSNAVCLTLGTGVGSGVIINGELYRGSSFAAGEIGHIPINECGPKCNCGGVACLEAYVGNNAISREASRVFGREVSLEDLSLLAKKGNKKASSVWKCTGRYLGVALTGVVNLLNPDIVVIGGGVANAGTILFDEIRKTILLRAMPVQAKHVKIAHAKLGSDAGLIGAGLLVGEKYHRVRRS